MQRLPGRGCTAEGRDRAVSKWVPVPKPQAQLTPVEPAPVLEQDGRTSQVFITANGKRFAELVEPTGFVLWLMEVTT
jgi:hypothetical protein